MTDVLEIGSRDWLPWAIALLVVGVVCVLVGLFRTPQAGPSVWFSALCKILALASVALFLVEPQLRSTRPKPGANALAVVIDNSRSMSIRAPGQATSLEDKLKQVLRREASWHARAAQDFSVRLYGFDHRLKALDGFEQVNFEGTSSAVGAAVQTVRERYTNRPAVGVMLFTDGMSTDALPDLQASGGVPIYPIVDIGRDQLRDISIADPTVIQTAFELAPVQIEATLQSTGLKDQAIVVRVIDEKGKSVAEQTIQSDSPQFQKRMRFQYRPTDPGIQFVRLRAMLKSEDDPDVLSPPSRQEVTTANNTRLLAVDRGGGPYRILYVAGRTSWDFKFFKRAVEEDQELRMAALVRIAKKEARFSFRDRSVSSTNPLFEGFESDQEATEQYDEPIFVRLGVRDSSELQGGFPKTESDLYQFDAIVLDDVEAAFFTQEQMLLIRQFVSSRGGGLLMMGGSESFERGGYRDTPIGDLLPVYLRTGGLTGASTAESTTSSGASSGGSNLGGSGWDDGETPGVAYRLTREGSLEPWMRLRASEVDEAKRLSQMPRFYTWNKIKDVKPGASVMAVASDDQEKTIPALIVQSFGSGRVGALTIGDMWRWSMRRATEDTDDLAQCWRQLARWLTSDVPRRLKVEIVPPAGSLEPHKLLIQVRDASFHPLDNATCQVSVLPPDGQLVSVDVSPDHEQPGLYVANFWSRADGPYVASVKANSEDGESIAEVDTGWTAEPSALEFRSLTPNLEELTALAEQTGGEVIDIDQLDAFVASLPSRQVPITETRLEPLWHRTTWLLLTIGCLCLEWGIRRYRGLP